MSEKFQYNKKPQEIVPTDNDINLLKDKILEMTERQEKERQRQFDDARRLAGKKAWSPVNLTIEESAVVLDEEQLGALGGFFKTAEVLKTHFTSNK